MGWVVAYEDPSYNPQARSHWAEERRPSREDALTFCEWVLHNGGVVQSVVERRDDGSVTHRLDHRDVLRALNIRDD